MSSEIPDGPPNPPSQSAFVWRSQIDTAPPRVQDVNIRTPEAEPYFRGRFALGNNKFSAREPLSNGSDFAEPANIKPKKIPRQDDSGIKCAPVDDDGTALTGSAGSGDFVTCTYAGAGPCAYFPADGSFSSGGSGCPQGVAQDPSATTDGASTIGAALTDDPNSASGDAPESPPPSIPTSSSDVLSPASAPPNSTPASTPASGSPSAGAPASPPAGSQTSAAASQTRSQSGAAMRLGVGGGGPSGMHGFMVAVVGVLVEDMDWTLRRAEWYGRATRTLYATYLSGLSEMLYLLVDALVAARKSINLFKHSTHTCGSGGAFS
ncbi:hypothetical protein C8R43DRAFT_1244388 [Mycena crocata]|nr:hypothetical protein C8R43DRAFT_1244388 [Mycena crocata]